jgi:hypothetical protein
MVVANPNNFAQVANVYDCIQQMLCIDVLYCMILLLIDVCFEYALSACVDVGHPLLVSEDFNIKATHLY